MYIPNKPIRNNHLGLFSVLELWPIMSLKVNPKVKIPFVFTQKKFKARMTKIVQKELILISTTHHIDSNKTVISFCDVFASNLHVHHKLCQFKSHLPVYSASV